jgi:hypothetical protein
MNAPTHPTPEDAVIEATRHWLVRGVIGLNLCPFAKAVHVKDQVRYRVSAATSADEVLADLEAELQHLHDTDPAQTDTTLLIVPQALQDFHEYNDCVRRGERLLKKLRLRGVLQIATFHPDYQFSDRDANDVENCTNRAPYPILHLLREESLDRAVAAFPDAADIFEHNEKTMRELGHEGFKRWMEG